MHSIVQQVLTVCCGLFFLFCDLSVQAHAEPLSKEYKLKAAYLFNFTRFIEWPDSAFADDEAPVRLCVQSDTAFYDFLSQLVGQRRVSEKKRPIEVLMASDNAADEQCHIAYVNCEHCSPEIFDSTLTVGDSPSSRKYGTVINFYQQKNKIRFEVVMPNLKKTRVTLSSELLKLARKVE